MKFVKLTRPDGKPLYVSESGIIIVDEALVTESTGRTRIVILGIMRFVRETVDEVLAKFAEGGS